MNIERILNDKEKIFALMEQVRPLINNPEATSKVENRGIIYAFTMLSMMILPKMFEELERRNK